MLVRNLAIVAYFTSGCMYSIHQYNMGDASPYSPHQSGKVVEAEAERSVILGLSGQTDYVEQAYDRLQKKCPKGRITSIATKHTTDLRFLSFVNHLRLRGICHT